MRNKSAVIIFGHVTIGYTGVVTWCTVVEWVHADLSRIVPILRYTSHARLMRSIALLKPTAHVGGRGEEAGL